MFILGNILWIIFGGLLGSLLYIFSGIVLCITIIGIPFGLQCFKLAGMILVPFGKRIVYEKPDVGIINTIMNIIWLIFFGWEIALTHFVFAIFLACTIIGIPFAKQHIKLIALAVFPFGKQIV